MKLVEQHIIKPSSPYYKELCDMCVNSTNLYNYATFCIRQHYFNRVGQRYEEDIFSDVEKNYINYNDINRKFVEIDQIDYRALPANISQQVLKLLDKNWKSFFALLGKKKKGKYDKKVDIPGYKKKGSRSIIILNVSTLSHTATSFKIPKSDTIISGMMHLDRATQIRIIPRNGYIVLEVIYEKAEAELKGNNKRYLSIDIGQNNLCACSSNVAKTFIINGRPVKSINRYYNMIKAKEQSKLKKVNNCYTSKKIAQLGLKRKNKIDWYFHNASKFIVEFCQLHNINTIIIGKNKGWKNEINMGRQNNQDFVSIPFESLINKISYKAKLVGINVILQEESYTSKASFIDNDFIPTYGAKPEGWKPSGKRKHRGLYLSKDKIKLNADINGSLNIMRKCLNVTSKNVLDIQRSIGLVVSPVVVGFYFGATKRNVNTFVQSEQS